ncbi:glycosyltransferase [Sphingobium boeckii]|uniref:Rhamnosyltransferase n=1 Tax=Sphingobium boeckii TaxID=1082345 RepID=A0A7W9AHE0_9SPHN|nr:glycosyltransferase [Sphingobium boeckii]MBB5685732.1 rhamnosyltransferase [Sphingobium boeckii]
MDFIRCYASLANPVVVVWNEFSRDNGRILSGVCGLTVCAIPTNIGLAAALNIGIEKAFDSGAERVLLLDQDSRPTPEMLGRLSSVFDAAVLQGVNVALAGPTLRDRKAHGVVNRVKDRNKAFEIVPRLSTSGSLIDREAFEKVRGMWADLFIDCIDHEWCYRAQSMGFSIVQAVDVDMNHDMGDSGINFLGHYKPIHRSPVRHYYITRNVIWMARQAYVPKMFTVMELLKLLYRIPVYFIVSSSKSKTAVGIVNGIRDGLFALPAKRRLDV